MMKTITQHRIDRLWREEHDLCDAEWSKELKEIDLIEAFN